MIKLYSLVVVTFIFSFVAPAQSLHRTVYHQYNDVVLTPQSQQALQELLIAAQQLHITSVVISSHADKRGTHQYNQALSQQRSNYMLQLLHIALGNNIPIAASFFGEDSLLNSGDADQEENRRTEITIAYQPGGETAAPAVISLTPYKEDVAEQKFDINLDDTSIVTGKDGTYIKISPGAFRNKRLQMARGKAVLLLREYYKPGDILLSGMHTVSDSGLLQTGGMFKIFVVQNTDTMLNETQQPVLVRMPDMNNMGGEMNVFDISHTSDDSLWNNTARRFTNILARWDFPPPILEMQDFYIDQTMRFKDWEIGRTWSDEYYTRVPVIFWGEKRNFNLRPYREYAKFVRYTLKKTDSVTLTINLFEKFRRRGRLKFNAKSLNTTFQVKYRSAFFEAVLPNLNIINCDRFLSYPERTDFYVETNGFSDANLMVYFKRLNAFMPAVWYKDSYVLHNVPPGEEVLLIAAGKKGEDYYYGKQPFTISKKATAKLDIEKVEYSQMKKMFAALGYKE